MLDQENKTHVEKSTNNINININININNNELSNSDPSTFYNNPLNDHDYCKHVANSLEKHNTNSRDRQIANNRDQLISDTNQDQQIVNNRPNQMVIKNRDQDIVNNREKRQRKEVYDPEFSQFTSSSEYSSSDAESDQESDQEYDPEEDPNRPWCNCERPDDGNFMIACEICKYWFHGSCVGVTSALSKKYEREGREYFCSSCDHALQSGTPRDAIPPRLIKKEKKKAPIQTTKRRGRPRKSDTVNREVTTRQSLRSAKRANSSIDSNLKPKGKSNARTESFEKFDDEQRLRELIKERKRDFFQKRRLTLQCRDDKRRKMGLNRHSLTAPLGQSLDSVASITSNPDMSNLPINIKSELKDKSQPNIVLQINRKKDGGTETSGQRIVTTIVKKRKASESSDSNVNELFTADPIQLGKKSRNSADRVPTPTLSKTKVSGDAASPNGETKLRLSSDQHEPPTKQRRKSKGTEPTAANGSSKHVDSIHIVQKIKECLDVRGKHLNDLDMKSIDTEKLASEIVTQLNECFKVGSSKYLPKYRSLIFNLSDQKNQALVRNVLTGEITPSRLVRMSPDEMAPNELAKWRERENKHSIELLKRDAELVAQQVIVKKTHKGEEVIAAPAPNDPDEPTAAKEDQELPSTPTKTPVRPDVSKTSTSPASAEVSKTSVSAAKELKTEPEDSTGESVKETISVSLKAGLDAPRSTPGHLPDSKDVEQSSASKQQEIKIEEAEKTSVKIEQEPQVAQPKRLRISIDTRLDPTNLSRLTEPLIKPVEKIAQSVDYSPSKISPNANVGSNEDEEEESEELYDPETSTIPQRISNETKQPNTNEPCWSGTITMSKIGKFDAMAKPVSGNSDFMKNEVNQTLMVCGKIKPDLVTSYIKQLKSTTKNQIMLVQLYPLADKDKDIFMNFVEHLYKNNRCGVIQPSGCHSILKDFYVLPISIGGPILEILKPIDAPGLDRKEQDCLLGLLVKTNRPSSASSSASGYTPSSIK